MSRFLTPTLFTASAIGVWFYNTQVADGAVVAFPFLEAVVGTDPVVLGQASVALLAGMGFVMGALEVLRGRRRGAAED